MESNTVTRPGPIEQAWRRLFPNTPYPDDEVAALRFITWEVEMYRAMYRELFDVLARNAFRIH